LFVWSPPRLLVLPIAIRSILIEPGAAMRRIALAIPGALLTTILAGHAVLALLILVSFLIGHVILPSTSATWRTSHTGSATRAAGMSVRRKACAPQPNRAAGR
jgi:hypothetical protein